MIYLLLVLIVLLLAFGMLRAGRSQVRRVKGFTILERGAAESIETGRGSFSASEASLGGAETGAALASAVPVRYLTTQAAIADRVALAVTSDPVNLTLTALVMKRAAESQQELDRYKGAISVAFLPAGLPYAAGTGLYTIDQDTHVSALSAMTGVELAIMTEPGVRRNRLPVPIADRAETAAVAYAVSGSPVFGEERYVAVEQLSDGRGGGIGGGGVHFALDILRVAVVLILLVVLVGAIQ